MIDPGVPWRDAVAELERLFGLRLDSRVQESTRIYIELLLKWNRAVDLVGNLTARQLLERCFFESYWAAEALSRDSAIADVGSGGGFPGLAMKLYRPDLEVTLLEPNLKKTVFLKEMARRLGVGVEIQPERGEAFRGWDGIDCAVMRGLRPSPGLLSILRRRGVSLLLLHGGVGAAALAGFQVVESKAQPGSLRRRRSLLAPA